jgi:hypothetical protein
MHNEFEMSLLGELSFFLGLQICQSNQGIFISQTKYIIEMLKMFGMEDCKLVITPMQTSCKLSKDDDSKSTDQRQYMSMIGSLLYVTTSRLDVMQTVGQVARFQATPKESHVLAVKRIFKYLKGTKEFGLWYLLAQGQTWSSTLQKCTNKTLTTSPFSNTYEADEVSPEAEAGVVVRLRCLQP